MTTDAQFNLSAFDDEQLSTGIALFEDYFTALNSRKELCAPANSPSSTTVAIIIASLYRCKGMLPQISARSPPEILDKHCTHISRLFHIA